MEKIEIQSCYCMYYDPEKNKSIIGNCFFTCIDNIKNVIVTNTSTFNSDMCYNIHQDLNRRGRFCGDCKEDSGLAVYSYHYYSCVQCRDYGYKNWLWYFTAALLPLTLFYILAVLFRLNVTSSALNGIVAIVQCMSSPVQMNVLDAAQYRFSKAAYKLIKFLVTVGCITNLDFFRMIYHPFCLHPKASILHIQSLDYIVALYPFILILITYGLVSVYDRNYRLLVWMWKPFKWCLYHYHKQWNIRTSLVEIFGTFILLAYVKILGVCFNLLSVTLTYDIYGNRLKNKYLYYNANIEYFGPQHLPFALLAILMGFVFVILPFLLLVVYPCRCFQKCLNHLGWRCQALHVFMDAFQGSYKTQPRDYRYFSAYYLLLRVFAASPTTDISFSISLLHIHDNSINISYDDDSISTIQSRCP